MTGLLKNNKFLMSEFDFEKNVDVNLEKITSGSNKKIWWKCAKGHEWQAIVASRSKGTGCPYCAGRLAIKGTNDLQTVNPDLSDEWNYSKNGGLTPSDVMPNSGKKVWWKCAKGHEWQQKMYSSPNNKLDN